MALAAAGGVDAPVLIDMVRFLVVPERFVVQVRRRLRDDRVLLLFDEEFVEDRVDARRRAGDQRGGSRRRDGEHPAVADAVLGDVLLQLLPVRAS